MTARFGGRMRRLILGGLVFGVLAAGADVRLGTPFSDGAVLQRGKPIAVWGTSERGTEVTVSFAGQRESAVADEAGKWSVRLAPLEDCREGRVLTAAGAGTVARAEDVVVGEVWMCSGQSNMELPFVGKNQRFCDRAGALSAQYLDRPDIRLLKMPRKTSVKPLAEVEVRWRKLEGKALAETEFSAVGTYFALELQVALGVPVGMIGAYWGGSNIDAWIPRVGLDRWAEHLPDTVAFEITESWNSVLAKYPISSAEAQPTVLFNGMVSPLAPYALRGVLWYQGETNAGVFEWPRYNLKLHALYDGLSTVFGQKGLSFYYAQLAPWGDPNVPLFQEWMTRFAKEEPCAAFAVINDLGNPNDVHPNDKELVAKRLLLHALKRDYSFPIEDSSPELIGWEIKDGAFHLRFSHVRSWYVYNENPEDGGRCDFEVSDWGSEWHPAVIANMTDLYQVDGDTLVVRSDGLKNPRRLRYLHNRPWKGNVYNEVNLPLGAFHVGY